MGADVRPRTLRVSSEGAMVVFSVTKDGLATGLSLGGEVQRGGAPSPRCALYAQEEAGKSDVAVTADERDETGAEVCQSAAPPPSLQEAAKQKSIDVQRGKLVSILLGPGFALLFFYLLVWNFYKGHLSPSKRRETSSKATGTAGLGRGSLAAGGSGGERSSAATDCVCRTRVGARELFPRSVAQGDSPESRGAAAPGALGGR